MKKRMVVAAAVGSALALGLAACSQAPTPGPTPPKAEFNAGLGKVFNPSDKKGGTLKYAISSDWDSVDPGDTYYGLSWNLLRLYGRSLVMFKVKPGAEGNQLTPDLAETLGVPSDGGKTWTYKIRAGVKYEDGTVVKCADVKYGVMRQLNHDVLVNGYTYFSDFLDLSDYTNTDGSVVSVYKDPTKDTKAITCTDDRTIVFHLKQAFGGFDYFAMLPATVPVPQAKDTGIKYKEHVLATGPYKFESYEAGKGFTLVRNTAWDSATDPNRKALPDKYTVAINVNANDIDQQIIAGSIDVDIAGTGVQPATLTSVLSTPDLKARADNPTIPRLWYTSINPKIAPLDNIECRKAVMYASDRTGYQAAYGGPFAGGDVATGLLPPIIPGSVPNIDPYKAGADNKGDLDKAKASLTACGKPDGFTINMSYRAERPKEKAVAESLQQSLGRVGIKLNLKPIATKDYFSLYAGKPSYRNDPVNGFGLMTNGWGADWNDGYGFLSQIVDSRVIRASGGSSNLSVIIPEVDQLLDKAIAEPDVSKREPIWGQIDKRVMEEAVILPGVWAKAITMRSKNAANIFINEAFGQYDYLAMSVA
jgi:peptide/nickel transport system substrate-binding protein